MTTKLISTVARSAASTAAHVARHPIGTATQAVTLVKGVAELGLDLVHGSRSQTRWTEADRPRTESTESTPSSESATSATSSGAAAAEEEVAKVAEKVAEAAPKAQEVVAEAAEKVEATATKVGSENKAAAPAADKVAAAAKTVEDAATEVASTTEDRAEKAAGTATKAADKAAKSEGAAAKPAATSKAAASKPAHQPAQGTAPTGEPVDTEEVRMDPEHESTPDSAHGDASEDPRDHIPGPDLATFAPPAPEDLPEPIVIEAE